MIAVRGLAHRYGPQDALRLPEWKVAQGERWLVLGRSGCGKTTLLHVIAGLPITPTVAGVYTLIDRSARAGTAAEAFAWFGTAVSIGIATGSAVAGLLVDEHGVRWAFGFAAVIAFCGALLGLARRGTLVVPRPSTRADETGEPSTLLSGRP